MTDPPVLYGRASQGRNRSSRRRRGCLFAVLCILAAGIVLLCVCAVFFREKLFLLLLVGVFMLPGLFQGFTTIPEIHGHIVELQSGVPVPGVVVAREATAWRPSDLEGHDRGPVKRAEFTATTDAEGRFEMPPVRWVHGLKGVHLVLYKEGWMPSFVDIAKGPGLWKLGCPLGQTNDPWHLYTCESVSWGKLKIQMRLSQPTYDGITICRRWGGKAEFECRLPNPDTDPDPWGEYFQRLLLRARWGEFSQAEVARQAVEHIERGGTIGCPAVSDLHEIAGWIPESDPDVTRKVAVLETAAVDHCTRFPEQRCCEVIVESQKRRLRREVPWSRPPDPPSRR